MRSNAMAFLATVVILFMPADASAQGYLNVFAGGNFGGNSGVSFDQSIDSPSKLDFGARLGAMSGGIFGGEIDLGYTPNFYGKGTIFDASSVLTVMGNIVLAMPAGPVRPYAVAGVGLTRRSVSAAMSSSQTSVSDSRAAYDVGGGVTFFWGGHVGINFDLRYFRNLSTGNAVLDLPNEPFDYARGSVGLVLHF